MGIKITTTFIVLSIATFPAHSFHMSPNSEAYKLQQFYETGACHTDTCPKSVRGDFVPLSELEHGSKEYWNTYCNEMLNTKFECK